MRALTIRQPWAWAIAVAGKDVENRGWPTSHRGQLAIHAGKGTDDPYGLPGDALRIYQQAGTGPAAALGAVIAVVDLVGCHQHDACSEWAVQGQWHWQLANVRPLARPFHAAVPSACGNYPPMLRPQCAASYPIRRSPVADTAITKAPAPTVPAEAAHLGANGLHAYMDGIPPDQDRCDCRSEAAHEDTMKANVAAATAVLEAAWPAITDHFTNLAIADFRQHMSALVDSRAEMERRVDDLREFEREYGNRLRAALNQDVASLQTMLYRLDGDLPSPHDVRVYMRRTGWVEGGRPGRSGTLWTRPRTRPGITEPDRIGLIHCMSAGDENYQGVIERLAKANGLSYGGQITAIKDSQVPPR